MKKMMVLALTLAMTMLAAAGLCDTLRVGMECNYAPYNWTQSDASDNAVAIAAGGYADGYDVRIAKIIAEKLGMDLEIVKTEWDGLTPALLSGNIDVIIAGMSPTAERRMTIDFTDAYYETELTVVVRKDSAFASAKNLADRSALCVYDVLFHQHQQRGKCGPRLQHCVGQRTADGRARQGRGDVLLQRGLRAVYQGKRLSCRADSFRREQDGLWRRRLPGVQYDL